MTPASNMSGSSAASSKYEMASDSNQENLSPKKRRGVWGPSHSYESDEASGPAQMLQSAKLSSNRTFTSGANQATRTSDSSDPTSTPACEPNTTAGQNETSTPISLAALQLERMFESATTVVESFVKTAASVVAGSGLGSNIMTTTDSPDATKTTTAETPSPSSLYRNPASAIQAFIEQACSSPCTPRPRVAESPPRRFIEQNVMDGSNEDLQEQQTPLGIFPLVSPAKSSSRRNEHETKLRIGVSVDLSDIDDDNDSPLGLRTKCYDPNGTKSPNGNDIAIGSLAIQLDEKYDIGRSISELTMKSSQGDATYKLSESRRMAYYAVGKHHKNSGRGGNRRCYFTGKLILGGSPFYAGSVQQGLRTLVVFCLPSALGLPNDGTERVFQKQSSDLTSLSKRSNVSSPGVIPLPREYVHTGSVLKRITTMTTSSSRRSTSMSKTTCTDDMSLLEEELDSNWDLDRDYLLKVLPDPSKDLLDEMNVRYPDQFETLPVQVRSPHCWRLFVKFCFFSGLPIAEGELHYKVRDEIAMEVYGEEIVLSHEVMEAVNGDSADILRLPNLKVFKYLRKHYTQQSGKLTDTIFQRTSWEMVRPEV